VKRTSIKIRKLTTLFFALTVLFGCAANFKSHHSNYSQDLNLTGDFTIEGKFRIKINNKSEKGYFTLKKTDNFIKIIYGKSFLLPEKELTLKINELFLFSEIAKYYELRNISLDLGIENIKVKELLYLISGKRKTVKLKGCLIEYPEGIRDIDGFRLPSRSLISCKYSSIEFLLKKIS
tara:strand:+ start:1235 stop:1768 length:534 start_codon:yes stop_codon:yes gene_type:complete